MKRSVILIVAVLFCISVSAQIASLDNTLSVKDTTAWRNFESKLKRIHRQRPVVALVLGGGGAKGAAHIGVLKYLEEKKIPVDLVVGTSMGGLMGSFYALGYTPEQIEEAVSDIDWDMMMTDRVPEEFISYNSKKYKEKYALSVPFDIADHKFLRSMPSAYIYGQNVSNLISSYTVGYQDNIDFSTLPIPFVCVATDLIEGVGHVWMSGKLNDALRTTMSIPLVFAPMRKDGMFLVDGGMRDNFPADIAKALGADIIIGVNVETPSKTYEEASNILDVISLVIDLSGKAATNRTMEIPDLVLHPEMDGIGSLGFSRENISRLIDNGYKAAEQNGEMFDRIAKAVGHNTLPVRKAATARALTLNKVKINNIHFTGVTDKEEDILMEKMGLHKGQMIDKTDLDQGIARMYASNSFKRVTYNLPGKDPDYDLLIDCEKGPVNQFGLGGRFDTEEMVSAFVNFELNAHTLYGYSLETTLKLSANPYARLEFFYDAPRTPVVGVGVDFRYTNTSLMSYSHSPFDISYLMTNQEIALSDLHWIFFDLRGGIRNRVTRITDYDPAINGEVFNRHNYQRFMALDDRWKKTTDYLGVFLNATLEKMEGGEYFPTSGYRIKLDYDWQFNTAMGKVENFMDNNYHSVAIGVKGALSSGIFTYIPSLDARILHAQNKDNIPLYALNTIGGDMNGRYFDQQVEFCGFNNVHSVKDAMVLLRNDFRLRIHNKQYLTAKAHIAVFADSVLGHYDISSLRNFINHNAELGVALEYSIDTVIGPIKADLQWSNTKTAGKYHGVGFYLSAGFKF